VTFYFGFKALPNLEEIADNLPETEWQKLLRPPRYEVQDVPQRLHQDPLPDRSRRSAPDLPRALL